MRIIGLGHYSRTGKDSLADFMVAGLRERGLKGKKFSFAWKLKDIAYQLYAWAGVMPAKHYETPEGQKDRSKKLIKMASAKYPEGPTVVDIWIDLGTPAIRDNVFDSTWVDYVLNTEHDCDVLIIPDVRFPNEVDAIRRSGGQVIQVTKEGVLPREGSVADAALLTFDDWDYRVYNNGTLEDLEAEANSIAWDIYFGDKIGVA